MRPYKSAWAELHFLLDWLADIGTGMLAEAVALRETSHMLSEPCYKRCVLRTPSSQSPFLIIFTL